MTEHVYQHSELWYALSQLSEICRFALPFVFVGISLVMVKQYRGRWSITALGGAAIALIARFISGPVTFTTAPEPQPAEGQNPLTLILFLYGTNLGYLLFAVGVLGFILRHPGIISASKTGAK